MASTIAVFVLDVSPGMATEVYDPGTGKRTSKLELCKEYICRKISPKIQAGRKTEQAGLITFGGSTNNPYFSSEEGTTAEAHDPADYTGVASIFPPQQAKAGMLSRVKAITVGKAVGNPIAALIVMDEVLRQHALNQKGAARWRKEVFLMLDANAKLRQTGWEDVLDRMLERGIILRVIGVNFDERSTEEMDDVQMKELPKVERFWRTFNDRLVDQLTQNASLSVADLAPALGDIFEALDAARGPKVDVSGSTLSKANFRIGDKEINPDEGIDIPIRYSKATAVSRPPTLKKVDARAVPKHRPLPESIGGGASQSQGAGSYSQIRDIRSVGAPQSYQSAGGPDLEAYTRYTILRKLDLDATHGDETTVSPHKPFHAVDVDEDVEADQESGQEEPKDHYEEIQVDKENIVKAYKYGDQWIPIKDEDFAPMETVEGIDVLGFLQQHNYDRYQSMGEVYYLWPDPDSIRSQIVFSALVEAMVEKKGVMLVRWVQKNNAVPKIGAVNAYLDTDGTEYMCFVQLPFAEDERNFLFPSLTTLISKTGSKITEHKLLPTPEQQDLMDQLVDEMDLDQLAEDGEPWYIPQSSFNPAINRVKEAIYHLAVTADLNSAPVPPPHPALLKYTQTPDQLVENSASTVDALKRALDIRIAPPKVKKGDKKQKAALAGEDVDIDALFGTEGNGGGSNSNQGKETARLIGEEYPLQDFAVAIESGHVEKAMQELGEVIEKMLDGSFAKAKHKTALKCVQQMRHQAIQLEEVGIYNRFFGTLRDSVNAHNSKKKDFWALVEDAEPSLQEITPEEANAAFAD